MPQNTQSDHKEATPNIAENAGSGQGVIRFSVVYFLVFLVLMFVTAPFILRLSSGNLIESALITVVLLSAVVTVGRSRRNLVWAIVLITPALLGKWVNYWRPGLMPPEVFVGAGLVFFVFVTLHFLDYILRTPRVNSEVLCAGVATYLLLGWVWAFAYALVAKLSPDSFAFTTGPDSIRLMEGFVALYFSYATLTTVGYGDIIPVSGGARMLAMVEATVGMFYVTLLIARLVTLYYSKGPSD